MCGESGKAAQDYTASRYQRRDANQRCLSLGLKSLTLCPEEICYFHSSPCAGVY